MPLDVYLNVAVGGVLTGLVYGLMALGLSVIFGVVRVVNFAHGEMMTIAMYIAVVLFSALHVDPLVLLVPIAAVLFAFGYVLQATLINPFVRPPRAQPVPAAGRARRSSSPMRLLIIFGPDARAVQTSYALDSMQFGPMIVDTTKVYAGAAAIVVTAALFAFFRFTLVGKAIRACADNYTGALVVGLDVKRLYALTFGLGTACVGAAGTMAVLVIDTDADARPRLHAARLRHRHHRRPGVDAGRARRRRSDRRHRGDRRPPVHAVGEEHVRVRHSGAGAAVPPAGAARPEGGMIGRFTAGVAPRGALLLALLFAALVAAPWFVNDYLLTVLIIILYFAYAGQAWNIMMGFAGQLSLGHALYVGLGAYVAATLFVRYGVGPWFGLLAAIPVAAACGAIIGYLAFRFGVAGRLFRHSHHRVRRIRPHRLRSSRLRQRHQRPVPAGLRARPHRSVAAARLADHVLLRHPRRDGRGLRAVPLSAAQPHRLFLARHPRGRSRRRAQPASTPSATR